MADMRPVPAKGLHPWQAELEAQAIAAGRSPDEARAWAYAVLRSIPDIRFLTPPQAPHI
jgi:hypothetical protein